MDMRMLPGNCLHEIFRERARAAPDRIAVSTSGDAVTYGELDRRSDLLAGRLAALGVRSDVLVGLCARRGTAAIVGMLGILKSGGAYVPIDPSYPADRVSYLLSDSAVPIVVADRDTAGTISGAHPAIVWLDGDRISLEPGTTALASGDGARVSAGHDLAYVIYTSGSTGAPKGVMVEHRNVVRLFDQTEQWFHFDDRDTWSLFHSISFDFSVWEIWGALLYGGRLVLLPETVSRSPELLISLLRTEQVTVLNQTPSAFHQLLAVMFAAGDDDRDLAEFALRLVIFGGERLDPRMLAPWMRRYGDQRPVLVNMYGITETTVHCTYRPITIADLDGEGASPIGWPVPDLRVYILDADGRPVRDDVPGEMYVAGGGVSRGYLNQPELTAQRFVGGDESLGEIRLYRSGDRAMRRPDGELVYLGRMDDQLKIRGYRIEPGEVEECLSDVPGVARAVVASSDFGDHDVRLVAYLVPARAVGSGQLPEAELVAAAERHTRAVLPRHLRPSVYRIVSEIPITLQGKVDRDALGK
jgi:amino acid adenylation domain-containing protein